MPSSTRLSAVIAALIFFAAPASAATVDISVTRSGDDVVFTGSGSIDLSDLSFLVSVYAATAAMAGNANNLVGMPPYVVSGLQGGADIFTGLDTVSLLSSTKSFNFDATGDIFGFGADGMLVVAPGYSSGDPIDFGWTVSDMSISDLDLNFGTLATTANNTVTLTLAAIPLPAGGALLLTGLGALGLARRMRKGAAKEPNAARG